MPSQTCMMAGGVQPDLWPSLVAGSYANTTQRSRPDPQPSLFISLPASQSQSLTLTRTIRGSQIVTLALVAHGCASVDDSHTGESERELGVADGPDEEPGTSYKRRFASYSLGGKFFRLSAGTRHDFLDD